MVIVTTKFSVTCLLIFKGKLTFKGETGKQDRKYVCCLQINNNFQSWWGHHSVYSSLDVQVQPVLCVCVCVQGACSRAPSCSERPSHSYVLWYGPTTSDYRSSNVAPSDSDRDCPSSRRDSESYQQAGPRLGVTAPSNDSESGGSHSPSPRASRRRQVSVADLVSHQQSGEWNVYILIFTWSTVTCNQ